MNERLLTQEMLIAFQHHLMDEEKSNATVEKYMRDLRNFYAYIGQRKVTKTETLTYKAELAKKYAITSANSMLAAMNSFLKYAEWFDCCVKQFPIQKKVYCSEQRELSRKEYFRLINAALLKNNQKMSLILQTIAGTGIRVSELEYITVEALEKGEAEVTCKGKTRTVFLVNKLKKKLRTYVERSKIETGPIFVTRTGRPISRYTIWKEMKKLCEEAGVLPGKVFPHNLRHLFARLFYEVEKDIAKLADILGHANINTTRIYIVSTGIEHRRKLERMHLIL